ncbi:hypothetical protein B0187_06800 [Haemophilus paracuniculus]|uniref:DUF4431 domain-containing protein n=1 Tax=Haemophilus paracuniculus TaxID=734 RepID=A0A1T0ARQ8_9PAST|nr:DUF4431 domain-containing protein [Haemophilus paracuniculus]OOR98964.1 hypothetical protein B0187_06800 [Haemophilus paracuniculus]
MKKILMAFLALCPTLAQTQPITTGQPVLLNGKLSIIKSLHPAPAFYGKPLPAIRPFNTLSVSPSFDDLEFMSNTVRTKLIQLSIDDVNLRNKVLRSEGKKATVYCYSLFPAHTAHHTTKVLCNVADIKFN